MAVVGELFFRQVFRQQARHLTRTSVDILLEPFGFFQLFQQLVPFAFQDDLNIQKRYDDLFHLN